MILPESYHAIVFYWTLAFLILFTLILPIKLKSPPIETEFTEAQAMLAHANTVAGANDDSDDALTYYPEELTGTYTMKHHQIRFFVIVPLVAAYLFLYGGTETAFGVCISTYAQDSYEMGVSEASYLTSAFWVALTLGRVFSGNIVAFIQN